MNDESLQTERPPRQSASAARSTVKHRQSHAVRVVLLASGTGSDANTYMPNRSSTQWWNRRDALVRCAASALFGPSTSCSPLSSVELVLLFDQDWSRMHMSYEDPSRSRGGKPALARPPSFIPTEQNVIRIWKQCCQRPNETVSQQGFRCKLIKSGPRGADNVNRGNLGAHHDGTNVGSSSSSKRELLELLQSSCPLDFLKLHRLNSSPQVLLRKVNRDQLMAVYMEWCLASKKNAKESKTSSGSGGNTSSRNSDEVSDGLDQALRDLLRPAAPFKNDENREAQDGSPGRVIAAVLHESSDHELPLRDDDHEVGMLADASRITAVLFAGAVRDMTRPEMQRLHATCQQAKVPVVKVRLGPVAEFTSKVLAVAAFHHSNQRLVRGLCHALSKSSPLATSTSEDTMKDWTENIGASGSGSTESRKRPRASLGGRNAPPSDSITDVQAAPAALEFKYIVFVPFDSSEVTLDLEARPLIWPVIRCVVNALWRSRVASNTTRTGPTHHGKMQSNGTTGAAHSATSSISSSLCVSRTTYHNQLALVFADKVVIDLDESTVIEMAGRHQAAPCEHQVLQLILEQMSKQRKPSSVESGESELSSSLSDTVQGIMARIGLPSLSSVAALPGRKVGSRSFLPSRAVALDLLHNEGVDLGAVFYKGLNFDCSRSDRSAQHDEKGSCTGAPQTLPVLVLLSLEPTDGGPKSTSALAPPTLLDELIRILSDRPDVDIIRSKLIRFSCMDRCAATVTLLQHFSYQIPSFFDSLLLQDCNILVRIDP